MLRATLQRRTTTQEQCRETNVARSILWPALDAFSSTTNNNCQLLPPIFSLITAFDMDLDEASVGP